MNSVLARRPQFMFGVMKYLIQGTPLSLKKLYTGVLKLQSYGWGYFNMQYYLDLILKILRNRSRAWPVLWGFQKSLRWFCHAARWQTIAVTNWASDVSPGRGGLAPLKQISFIGIGDTAHTKHQLKHTSKVKIICLGSKTASIKPVCTWTHMPIL